MQYLFPRIVLRELRVEPLFRESMFELMIGRRVCFRASGEWCAERTTGCDVSSYTMSLPRQVETYELHRHSQLDRSSKTKKACRLIAGHTRVAANELAALRSEMHGFRGLGRQTSSRHPDSSFRRASRG